MASSRPASTRDSDSGRGPWGSSPPQAAGGFQRQAATSQTWICRKAGCRRFSVNRATPASGDVLRHLAQTQALLGLV